MHMIFRYCILSAVSSEQQAIEGKDSLDHQYRAARQYGDSMGGIFVREFRAEGYSRTGYWDLSQAFLDAPPLGEMAQGILRHEFDVIILESFDRLGDLGFMLFNFLKPHRVQLRSVQQILPIVDPAEYNPRFDDSTPTMINNALNTNVYRINKVVRAFAVGLPRRAKDGFYSSHVPYGYIKQGNAEHSKIRFANQHPRPQGRGIAFISQNFHSVKSYNCPRWHSLRHRISGLSHNRAWHP